MGRFKIMAKEYLSFRDCKLSEELPMFIPCSKCVNGMIYLKDDKGTILEGSTCECLDEWKRLKRVQRVLTTAKVPLRAIDYQISSYPQPLAIKNIIAFISNYKTAIEHGFNLYIRGVSNTGKTYLGCYILKMFAYLGYSVEYTSFRDLVTYIEKNRFKLQEGLKDPDEIFNSDVLFIEDLPRDDYTDSFVADMINTGLKYRQHGNRITVFSSSTPISDLNLRKDFVNIINNRTKEIILFNQFNANLEVDSFFDT